MAMERELKAHENRARWKETLKERCVHRIKLQVSGHRHRERPRRGLITRSAQRESGHHDRRVVRRGGEPRF